jgi:hypothetical protein
MTITFNELRKIKDSLPDGSMHQIAKQLNITVETVRNYFGGTNYDKGTCTGISVEQGPGGGLVSIEDTTIIDLAKQILQENAININ